MREGKILIVGNLVKLTRERQTRDLETGHERGLVWDEHAADRIVYFFKNFLRHSKGEWAGQPFELAPWQEHDILRPLFGWKREDGLRRFRTAYIEVARKNGKSTMAAGVGLYLFLADGEPGAEVYSAATKRDQAKIVHQEAKSMVRKSPDLRRFAVLRKNNIFHLESGSKYEPLGADADTLDGLNVHGAIVDEVHAHKTSDLWNILETATGSRRQPLMFAVTTAGFDQTTICGELHGHAENILNGLVEDDQFFAYVASIDEEDDWKDPAVWGKANPNLGVSVKMESLEKDCNRAKRSPAFQNTFRRLKLNEWTEQSTRWMDKQAWMKAAGQVDEGSLKGRECYGGLDLSSTLDLTALALDFPIENKHKAIFRFWLPKDGLKERIDRDRVPYDAWARDGFLTLTDGPVVDYKAIRLEIKVLNERFNIKEIAFDRWNATQIATQLGDDDGFNMVKFGQGYVSMSWPTKELMTLVLSKRIEHGGHPVMNWMIANTVVSSDPAGNLKPDKKKSRHKIDGVYALVMAIARGGLKGSVKKSIYATRGVISV